MAFYLALAVMALAVFATRIFGALLMSRVPTGPKVERFLEGLSVSVIAAMVASLLIEADSRIIVATLIATVVMAFTRSMNWAMLTGILTAAIYPLLLDFFASGIG